MATKHVIRCYDSGKLMFEIEAPSSINPEKILRRLICRDLSAQEVIDGSRRRNDRKYWDAFAMTPYRRGHTMMAGTNPHYSLKTVEIN